MTHADWYSYRQITFQRRHIEFILSHATDFQAGRWPRQPSDSGYTDAPVSSRQIKTEATFAKAASIWAEVEERLEQCEAKNRFGHWENDGLLCLGYYLNGFDVSWLARYKHCSEIEIINRINRAISYAASGPCRRWVECPEDCRRKDICPRPLRPAESYPDWRRRRAFRWR